MTDSLAVGIVVVPGVGFGMLYQPMLTRVSVALASPYPKAAVRLRFSAAAIDGLLIASTFFSYVYAGSVLLPLHSWKHLL